MSFKRGVMALSKLQRQRNEEKISELLATEINVSISENKKFKKFIAQVLEKHNIDLSIDAGVQLLKKVFRKVKQNEFKPPLLEAALEQWAENYKKLEKEINEDTRRLYASQPRGILGKLREEGEVGTNTWGTDLDIQCLLKKHISTPESVIDKSVCIVDPIDLDTPTRLEEKIKEFVAKNADKTFRLLVPVNTNNSHWRLAMLKLENGSVTRASLWDSLSDPNLDEKPVYKNLELATKLQDKVAFQAAGIQKNDYSCMDYVVQKALQRKYPDGVEADITPILKATNAKELREAVIHCMIENSVELSGEKKILSEINETVSHKKNYDKALESAIHKKLLANGKSLQEKFDALLAQELDKLYKTHQDITNEDKLVTQARKSVFEQLLKSHGLFKPEDAAKRDAVDNAQLTAAKKV